MLYVDHVRIPFGRMLMNHLMANTPEELREAAEQLGLSAYIQSPGTEKEHLDVSESKRREALAMGARPVTGRELVNLVQTKRAAIRSLPGSEGRSKSCGSRSATPASRHGSTIAQETFGPRNRPRRSTQDFVLPWTAFRFFSAGSRVGNRQVDEARKGGSGPRGYRITGGICRRWSCCSGDFGRGSDGEKPTSPPPPFQRPCGGLP